jgi:hypothetical protein
MIYPLSCWWKCLVPTYIKGSILDGQAGGRGQGADVFHKNVEKGRTFGLKAQIVFLAFFRKYEWHKPYLYHLNVLLTWGP